MRNPTTPKRDIRLIPYYPDEVSKRRKDIHIQTLRVFGEMKEYTRQYSKERSRYNKTQLDAMLVRGHYRCLESEKFTHKRGETIWIAPYIKGLDRELYKKIVNLKA